MSLESLKPEEIKYQLINLIVNLDDNKKLKQLMNFLQKEQVKSESDGRKRVFGFGKGTFTYMSKDFDEPLDDFKDYIS